MSDRHPTWDEILSPEDARVILDDGPGTGIDGRYGPEIRDFPDDEDSVFPDELDHALDLQDEAQHADGVPLGDLDQHVQRREIERAEEKAVSPHVCIVPASYDRGVLGTTAAVVPGNPATDAGPLQQLAHWPGDGRECVPVAVFVQPSPPFPTASGATVLRLFTRVQFGNQGGKFTFDADVGTGTAFTVNCSSIYVSVGMDASTGLGSSLRPTWDVFGSIGFYPINRTRPLTRTAYIEGLTAGATTTLVRPNFANTVEFIGRSDRTVQVTLNFLDLAGNVVTQRHLTASQYGDYFPIPNDAYLINVINDSGSTTISLRIIFGLGF